jgi:hypothetical protein
MAVIFQSCTTDVRLYLALGHWRALLKIAELFGWQPAGTVLSSERNWPGGYLTNDNQVVTAEDAAHLAQSLEEALLDIPRFRAAEPARIGANDTWQAAELESQALPECRETSLLEQFAGTEGRAVVLDAIALCRLGAFAIR